MATRRRYGLPKPNDEMVTMERGIFTVDDETAQASGYAYRAINMQRILGDPVAGWAPRPGLRHSATGQASARTQGAIEWTDTPPLSGFVTSVVYVTAGVVYIGGTVQLSQANITAATAALSTSASIIYITEFADGLVFSDGVNDPFHWDGTPNGGITLMGNCPPLYGQPVVYYGRFFGIVAEDARRDEIVWSEPNQPNVGYDAGGYNNAWRLIQNNSGPLYALAATNTALYFFRESSIGGVWGSVTSAFATTGTNEAVVDKGSGCKLPQSVIVVKERVYYMDTAFRPRVIEGFGNPTESQHPHMWESFEALHKTLNPNLSLGVPNGHVAYSTALDMVSWVVGIFYSDGYTVANEQILVNFDADTGAYLGYWALSRNVDAAGWTDIGAIASCSLETVALYLCHDEHQYTFKTSGTAWNDENSAGTKFSLTHQIESREMLYDKRAEQTLDEVVLHWRAFPRPDQGFTSAWSNDVHIVTPNGVDALTTSNATLASSLRDVLGADSHGRWFRVRVTLRPTTLSQIPSVALTGIEATAYYEDMEVTRE